MIQVKLCQFRHSRYPFFQKHILRLIVFRHWIICTYLVVVIVIVIVFFFSKFYLTRFFFFGILISSQTGRAHLILVSITPGKPGGAIGIITLEGEFFLLITFYLVLFCMNIDFFYAS